MNGKHLLLLIPMLFIAWGASAQQEETAFAYANYHRYYKEARQAQDNPEKVEAITRLRDYFSTHPYRMYPKPDQSAHWYVEQLTMEGTFKDMDAEDRELSKNLNQGYSTTQSDRVGIFIGRAFERIYIIAHAYRNGELTRAEALSDKVLKAILHYGHMETGRSNKAQRFHASCFAIPTAAVNIYFALLEEMNLAEQGKGSRQLTDACDMLKVLGLQAYTQPLRNDETDNNVVSIERFRNHVWWVGGNALAYRSLLPVAAMYSSVPMVDVLAEVCQRGISRTSQHTYHEAFWTEGFTADGAGWGHGKQCLIWGYPIDGTFNALNILGMLKGTPWGKTLTRDNAEAIMNFLRGSNWYYYKGYRLPCLDRGSYAYSPDERAIPYAKMLKLITTDWLDSFTPEEQQELLALQKEVNKRRITMSGYPDGMYSGIRWFFNNDDLIKKTPDCHVIVNMASVRCDGLESAVNMADEYNFYPTDGMTLFQRTGNEYSGIMGAWDVTASPGVTARMGMEQLVPVTNWRGYCSKHNFAAGSTDNRDNAVAGYIFEKMNASDKEGVNDKGSASGKNRTLYGVKAYKSYFFQQDYMVALGAGVTNLTPDVAGNIRTTLDQTTWDGEVFIWKNGTKQTVAEGIQPWHSQSDTHTWVVQEGKFAYTLLPEYTQEAYVSCETKATEWVKRNKSNASKKGLPKEAKILRIWADHGQKPVNDTYGYAVYTGKGLPSENLPLHVLQNDTLVQAVMSADATLIQAVFYPGNKGLQAEGITLSASAPCTVQIKKEADAYIFTATDACMNPDLKEITVTFNGKEVNIPLPQGMYSGKQGTVTVPHNGKY